MIHFEAFNGKVRMGEHNDGCISVRPSLLELFATTKRPYLPLDENDFEWAFQDAGTITEEGHPVLDPRIVVHVGKMPIGIVQGAEQMDAELVEAILHRIEAQLVGLGVE